MVFVEVGEVWRRVGDVETEICFGMVRQAQANKAT